MDRIRIGTVGYLNTAPLTTDLDPERFEVVADHPRGIAERLASGDVELALAPVAAVLTDGDFRILPGWCIGSDGPVHSVVITAETEPEAWTEVVLDGESRTSVTLAQLLLRDGPLAERLQGELPVRTVAPGAGPETARGTVAAVVIGDPARALPDRLSVRVDLGALWKEWTGKPFVFAVWAGRPGVSEEVRRAVREAGAVGTSRIAERYTGDDRTYLTDFIRYPLDEPALMGLRRYAALAHDAGLVGTEHVRLFEPAVTARPRDPSVDRLLADAADGVLLSVDALHTLAAHATQADLAAAARLRRGGVRDDGEASYLPVESLPAPVVREGGAALQAALAGAVARHALAVHLPGLEALPRGEALALVTAAAAAGLDVVGPEPSALSTSDEAGAAEVLADLASAGLTTVTLTEPTQSPALRRAVREAGVVRDAAFTLATDDDLTALVPFLVALRGEHLAGPPVASLTLHAQLPAGALVEPGAVTTATWLRAVALARLALPDGVRISASPATVGVEACQTAQFLGADDLGWVGAAGPGLGADPERIERFGVDVETAERVLRVGGFEPIRRDARWSGRGGAVTRLRRVRRPEERAKP